jgi:hypothetical protein
MAAGAADDPPPEYVDPPEGCQPPELDPDPLYPPA